MMWLVWRQHRKQLLVALIGLAALALVLIPSGRSAHKEAQAYVKCLDGLGNADFVSPERGDSCEALADTFGATHETWAYAGILLLFLPLLIGLFWGAPLVAREVEQGTHRLVWTQGISRRRWVLTKFGFVGAVVLLLAALYAALITWWMEPLNDTITPRFTLIFFDQQGVVPVAYTLFAVALGVFAGTMLRKVIPAMAVTVVAFVAARITVALAVRPNIQEPLTRTALVSGGEPVLPNPALGNWIQAADIYDASGKLRSTGNTGYCTPRPDGPGTCGEYGAGAYNSWTYQPGSRFWLFQWVEVSLFAAVSVLLMYLALRQVRRRIT